jgi:hypothetical protein
MTLIFVIILLIWILVLQSRISKLEKRFGLREELPQKQEKAFSQSKAAIPNISEGQEDAVSAVAPTQSEPQTIPPQTPPATGSEETETPFAQRPASDVFVWLREGFLIKVGSLMLFLGVAWFVSYAFSQGWVNPFMRIMLGLLTALVAYGLSYWRKRFDINQSIILNALGTGIVMAVVSAAQFVYSMFAPTFALGIMVVAILYTLYVSIQFKRETLAVLAAVAGLVAPLLTNQAQPDMSAFFLYLLIYTIAFVWIAVRVDWLSLVLTLLIGVGFYEFLYQVTGDITDIAVFLLFIYLFTAVFYVVSLLSGLLRRTTAATIDVYVGALNALLLLYWVNALVPDAMQSLVTSVAAFFAATAAYVLYKRNVFVNFVYLHAGIATVFFIAANAYAFSGYTLEFMYALESGLVISVLMLMRRPPRMVTISSFSFVLPIMLSFPSLSAAAWDHSWLHPDAYALYGLVSVSALVSIVALIRGYRTTFAAFVSVFWVYLALLIWLISNALLTGANVQVVCLLAYAVLSTLSLFCAVELRASREAKYIFLASYLLPALFSLSVLFLNPAWNHGWFHAASGATFLFILLLLLMAGYLASKNNVVQNGEESFEDVITVLLAGAGLFLVGLVWQVTHGMFARGDVAVMTSLFVYSISGLVMYIVGRTQNIRGLRLAAGVVLGAVVLRLLLIDVWNMEIIWRVVTFVGVGVLFIFTSFLESSNLKKLVTSEGEQ